ncbi:MAG TPA: ABC transporter permease subunit [Solirubrobacterales bacterium]|jgi:ABC-type transport system involved in multi-copper enzyme maturation permease subunit|nr:ABC transporter permease subunit [Solirubrobacterales bacterium]
MNATALRSAATVVALSMQEGIRRRVFLAVLVLTLAFLGLYALGAHFAFRDVDEFAAGETEILDPHAFTGATIFGLAMFATLFLGAVLAVFLTLGVVRGDAESGLLQPIVVRPIGRTTMLLARFAGAALLSAAYVVVVYLAAWAITKATGDWSPDHLLGPALGLALAVAIIAALSLLASTVLSVTAQGIVVFMVFGAGLTAGLLAQIGNAINSDSLHTIGRVASWALPFEGLYAAGLHALISGTSGLTGVVLQLGPFGGSEAAGPELIAWAFLYLLGILALAAFVFSRRDL